MKALPDTLRQIMGDLVRKRLWPVALLLLAVAVLAPVLIGGSASEGAAPAPVATAPPPVAAATPPATAGVKTTRGGRIADPFYDPPAPPKEAAADSSPAPTPTPSSGEGAPSAGDDGAASAPASAAASTRPSRAAPARRFAYYRLVARWGESREAPARRVARLTPLGGRDNPAALYLGPTRAHTLWAVFVLGPNATSRGDGICKSGTGCRMIGLKAGDRQRVSVHGADGRVVRRFWLSVRSVKKLTTASLAARRTRTRLHSDGRAVLRQMRQDPILAAVLAKARYDSKSRLLDATDPATGVEKAAG